MGNGCRRNTVLYHLLSSGIIKHTMKGIKKVHSKVAASGWWKCQDLCADCTLSATHKEGFNSYSANYPTMCTINFYGLLWNVIWPFLSSNIASSDSEGKHILKWHSVKEIQSPGTKWNGWCPLPEEQLWKLCSFPDMSKRKPSSETGNLCVGSLVISSFKSLMPYIKATTDHVWAELAF